MKIMDVYESGKKQAVKVQYVIKIYGLVQGIGFRPFVYNKASEFNIYGYVKNAGGAVIIYCEGEKENIKQFILGILKNPPELAQIEKIQCIKVKNKYLCNENTSKSFEIKESNKKEKGIKIISPDIGICPKCLEEIKNKKSRRYKYVFTNCTKCGPRYSIIKALPYDRKNTTMEKFKLCEKCKEEYENNANRRFDAETNCCSKCGPKLYLLDNMGKEIICDDVIGTAVKLLEDGRILAIKGIGGFHLTCNGRDEQAIKLLREKKHRKDKPLALMAKDVEVIKEICFLSEKEEETLKSNKRPIVILKKKDSAKVSEIIAPKQNSLGIMLPYTPLHYMILNDKLNFLVMTSGNITKMAMEYKNEEAVKHLSTVADYFLLNNRDIFIQEDDSVVKIIKGRERVIRRGRGYAPFTSKVNTKKQIAAVGSQQKNTVCISKDSYAYLSQYLGDLEEMSCFENFKYVLEHLTNILEIKPEILVHDIHPFYLSTKYAKEQNLRKIEVQHHHAHMVSCMGEHNIHEKVIGVIFDGTGLGLDNAIWGGEFLLGNRKTFKRVGQLEYIKIQGGDKSIKEPWRCAVSYLYSLGLDSSEVIKNVSREKFKLLERALDYNLNCFFSSSMGRLFDAVAAICGIRNNIDYNGQAAIELENIIDKKVKESYLFYIKEENNVHEIQYRDIIEGIIKDLQNHEEISKISAKFHNSIIKASCELVCRIREEEEINKVVLSGGVFENDYLLVNLSRILREKKFEVFYNEQIPTNDEGISFGQLQAASAILEEEEGVIK